MLLRGTAVVWSLVYSITVAVGNGCNARSDILFGCGKWGLGIHKPKPSWIGEDPVIPKSHQPQRVENPKWLWTSGTYLYLHMNVHRLLQASGRGAATMSPV